ncbi:unnamed protein product [Cochlearia groenlandica]
MCKDLGFKEGAFKIHCDSHSALGLAKNGGSSGHEANPVSQLALYACVLLSSSPRRHTCKKKSEQVKLEVIFGCSAQRTENMFVSERWVNHRGSVGTYNFQIQCQSSVGVFRFFIVFSEEELHQKVSELEKKKRRRKVSDDKGVPIYGGSCRKSEMNEWQWFRRQEYKRGGTGSNGELSGSERRSTRELKGGKGTKQSAVSKPPLQAAGEKELKHARGLSFSGHQTAGSNRSVLKMTTSTVYTANPDPGESVQKQSCWCEFQRPPNRQCKTPEKSQ